MIEPLQIAFEVECLSEHAFDVWTNRIGTWWPADHSVSGNPEAVVLEARVGGRLYERTPDGREHEWGEIMLWEPPRRFAYWWHLGRDREVATQVDIRFEGLGPSRTRVVIEHRGWTSLGADAAIARSKPHRLGNLAAALPRGVEEGSAVMAGTKDDPWQLATPPGSSAYTMYRDEDADPPALVCQVGSTTLRYDAQAIGDLHSWLRERGGWVELGAADEKKEAAPGTVEAWGRSADNPVGGWYGLRNGYRGRFGMYLPPLLELLGIAELTHDARNNKMRAI